jgi:16S rRNA (guanine527-N7)-methyltransferase
VSGSPAAVLAATTQALGLVLAPATQQTLLDYLALLQRWNRVYNLTAVRDAAQMLSHHLADALAVLPPLARHAGTRRLDLLDVGSGGGLPGVVIAACTPHAVTCVDTVGKKARFIQQVSAELALPGLRAEHSRVEALPAQPGFDLITARAFASLADLVKLTRHLLRPGGVWMAMKGQHPADEIAALPTDIDVFHVEPLQVPGLDAQRCLVWMR